MLRYLVVACRSEPALCALGDRFAVIEHVLFAVSGRRWEHKLAVRAREQEVMSLGNPVPLEAMGTFE